MLTLELDHRRVRQQLQELSQALDRQQPQTLAAIGRDLVTSAHRDFQTKSRGGTGADGVRWPAVTPTEARRKARLGKRAIGVRTGELGDLANLRATVVTDSVFVTFQDQPKANYFNAQRPLLPSRLPTPWYRSADRTLQDGVDAVAAQFND